jgi:hypothetical protein
MPKKYRVEMSLVDDETNTTEASDTHTERYRTDTEANEAFGEKVKAAREKGKGQGQEQE